MGYFFIAFVIKFIEYLEKFNASFFFNTESFALKPAENIIASKSLIKLSINF